MRYFYTIIASLLLLSSCINGDHMQQNSAPNDRRISLSASINQLAATRVNDDGFCDGDAIGIYVVDYSGDNPGDLKVSGNRANNLRYTYDEANNKWHSDYDIFFKDETTPVDIYGYYPLGEPDNVSSNPFTLQQNQSGESGNGDMGGYEASDFLWGKSTKVAPTESQIMITLQHRMSSVRVELIEGEGFAEGEWSGLDKTVVVKNLKRESLINLATGEVTAKGVIENAGTVPYRKDNMFRAIVVPQSVAAGTELFSLSVGSVPYTFRKDEAFEYLSGKMHKFAITVDKKETSGEYVFTLSGEAITAWENDDVSHDAAMREYIIINSTAGGLKDAIIAAGKDYTKLQNLKITGQIKDSDFFFMRDEMTQLAYLNLKEVDIEKQDKYLYLRYDQPPILKHNVIAIPNYAFHYKPSLRRIIFPDNLQTIGDGAFRQTPLIGNLIIPEGVFCIEAAAFFNCSDLNGSITLPSTLEYIGREAFWGSGISGKLVLPDNLKYIGEGAFFCCTNLTGELNLPNKITTIEDETFFQCGFTGSLKIPEGILSIGYRAFSQCYFNNKLYLNEYLIDIGKEAFNGCLFNGTLELPSQLKLIEDYAFGRNNFIGNLILPESLISIGRGAFSDNPTLTGTIKVPSNIESIPSFLFAGCSQITEVNLHSNIGYIGESAFVNCYQLNSIISESLTPPTISAGAFDGVPKDNFTVAVPEQAVKSYRTAPGWSDFKRVSAHHELVCRPSAAISLNAESTRTLVLNAESDWEVTECPDWCTLSQYSGSKKTELTLTISELTSGSAMRSGEIVFKLKDKDYTHTCSVSQYDYRYRENEVIALQTASKGNTGGINIVFLGDGYDGKDISEGRYLQDMQEQINNFFAIQPYTAYRDYFNVYTAIAVSPESGVGTVNTIKHNKFETTYTGGVGLKCNNDAVFNYILDMNTSVDESNINQALVVLVPNASDYGGITYMWGDGSAIAICPKSNMAYPFDTRGILQHEAGGHGFGKLGDEYIYHNAFIDACPCMCCAHVPEFNRNKALGWFDNLSLTGKMHEVPWSHLIFDDRYSDIVDIYEGGFMHARGVFRSEHNSCMNNNIPYFSTISRESIVRRIKRYAGEEYSFEDFVANDVRVASAATKSDMGSSATSASRHQNQPVFYSGSPLSNRKN